MKYLLPVIVVTTLFLPGCGGGGKSPETLAAYAGHYTGAFTRPAGGFEGADSGTLDITVSSTGAITGSGTSALHGAVMLRSGVSSIDLSGNVNLDLYSSGNSTTNASDDRYSGTLTLTSSGTLSGTLEIYYDFDLTSFPTAFNLQRQSSGN